MGRAARANPRAATPGKDAEAVAMARIIRGCSWITTPKQLEMVLTRFPEAERDAVRDFLWEHCAFDANAIEQEERRGFEHRRFHAAYGQRPAIETKLEGLPADMRRAIDILTRHQRGD
jgi:hypothetical protein